MQSTQNGLQTSHPSLQACSSYHELPPGMACPAASKAAGAAALHLAIPSPILLFALSATLSFMRFLCFGERKEREIHCREGLKIMLGWENSKHIFTQPITQTGLYSKVPWGRKRSTFCCSFVTLFCAQIAFLPWVRPLSLSGWVALQVTVGFSNFQFWRLGGIPQLNSWLSSL